MWSRGFTTRAAASTYRSSSAVLLGYAVQADESCVLFIAPEDLVEIIKPNETKIERG